MAEFPTQARAVIIGGGIVGCSTAYHLAGLGWREVVLLERAKLTSGSTFHAAGLVGQLRSSANITQLLKYSVELYGRLEEETGQATGWKPNGGLRLACNAERMIEIERQATMAHSFGLEMDLLTPKQAQDLWPLMDIADLVGAAYLPTDGQVNPSDITQALAKGARSKGARIIEDCPVTAIHIKDGCVTGVVTAQGDIACEVVINCAGQWAREVGALAGVVVPLQSVQHQYLITEAIAGIEPGLPTLRDPDRLTYFKEDVGGLVMGGYERNPIPWAQDGIPEGFHFSLLDTDVDHFEPLMEQALARVPALAEAGVKEMINGPESFTPDGNFILGEAPEVGGFFVGAGFNAFGIAGGGKAETGGNVEHRVNALGHGALNRRRVGDGSFGEADAKLGEAVCVGRRAMQNRDPPAVGRQQLDERAANEARAAGDERGRRVRTRRAHRTGFSGPRPVYRLMKAATGAASKASWRNWRRHAETTISLPRPGDLVAITPLQVEVKRRENPRRVSSCSPVISS